MRKWKCIKSNDEKKWTVGKIYETKDDGIGLISDDNDKGFVEPWDFWSGTEFEEVKDFTLADLKPCMVVVRRNGSVCGIFQLKDKLKLQEDLISGNCETDDYNDDLTCKCGKNFDIMQVYNFSDDLFGISIEQRELLFERIEKSPQQLKLEELETKQREIADEMAKLRKEME